MQDLEQNVINHIKGLVIDGVHKAQSGHPGGALSSMDFAYVLFKDFLKFDPDDASWMGRDRFVLSAGHESMLLYSYLHMIGWLPIDELKRFRQLHSQTPGHPENFMTKGVECTTGPLGQGAAMSVGMSIAALHLAAKVDEELFTQKVYALVGDGCMQEDVTLGAASYAGHLQLRNLIWFYDQNRVQISGHIDRATSDDEEKIFHGFGWQVLKVDGHDREALRQVLKAAQSAMKPTLIIGNTTMAKGVATMEGDHETHGSPLPAEERKKTKERLGLDASVDFSMPDAVKGKFQEHFPQLREQVALWKKKLAVKRQNKEFDALWQNYFKTKVAVDMLPMPAWPQDKGIATRNAFGDVIKEWATVLPQLVGGSADLEPSNMTGPFAKVVGDFQKDSRQGRNFAFGVREFPMSAIANGLALFGGLIPFDATFLVFSDYSRPALRLGAIQKIRVIHEFTHDSFYLGEDGPTHQPIEHVMSLRLIPDFFVMRPADARETFCMMQEAISMQAPTALCLSRQKLPPLPIDDAKISQSRKGGYVVWESSSKATLILAATGSEVSLALEVAKKLAPMIAVRVVSLPCWELFFAQSAEYRKQVLPPSITKRVSLEAGVTLGWERIVGGEGLTIGIDHFGASAPMEALAQEFGFTTEQVIKKIREFYQIG